MPVFRSVLRVASLAALAFTTACATDGYGYAPQYPPGYDSGMGSGQYYQPGDLFGGQNVADVRAFYEPLAPYGQWTESQFGYAFRPQVDANWRPYVNGRWGENRLWLSDDPWGWATDHYGRWGYDQRIGWVWVPGTEWAPSWVAWREDDQQDVAGWAPVPPGVAYSFGVGFGSALAYSAWNDWYAPSWVWVPRRNLYAPGFGGGVLPWRYGQNYWRGSHWNHQPGWNGGGRPGYGRPGYGRPGYDGNGRPPGYDGNRPPRNNAAGRPNPGQSGRPVTGGNAAGGGQWAGRPGEGQGRPPSGQWQPPRGGYGQPGTGTGTGTGNGNGYGYGNTGSNWAGGSPQGRPPRGTNAGQGRPPRSDIANAPPPQNWQRPAGGRPAQGYAGNADRNPGANGNAGNDNRGNGGIGRSPNARPAGGPPPNPAYAAASPPPAPVARPAPAPRPERPKRPARNTAESGNERPD